MPGDREHALLLLLDVSTQEIPWHSYGGHSVMLLIAARWFSYGKPAKTASYPFK